MSWLRRLVNTIRPATLERDIDREIAFHLREREEDIGAGGVATEEARRRARVQFGNPLVQRDRTRDIDVAMWLDMMLRNIRHAIRALIRVPGFSVTVVLTLALGIGANSAVFSAMDAVLIRPLPFREPDQLMSLTQAMERTGETDAATVRVLDWARLNTTFLGITGHMMEDASDTTGDQPERVRRATVLPRFLEVWRIEPLIGRGFIEAEHRLGGPAAVLISERYWRRRFGADLDYNRTVQRINRTLDAVSALPGVEAAATTLSLSGLPGQVQIAFTLAEKRDAIDVPLIADSRLVSADYFRAMRIPLLSGERCRSVTTADGTTEVLVNRSFADRYLPDRTPIGLHIAGNTPDRIVGIVGDARERGIDQSPVPTVYGCFSAATPMPWFVVRTSGGPRAAVPAIRRTINQLEPLRSVYDIATLDDRIGNTHAQNRLRTLALVLFAATALSLSCLGVYGTLSYIVSLRRREVGLRLALGAARSSVVRQFVVQGLRMFAVACACGLALSIAFTMLLSGMLYGVTRFDPTTLSSVVIIVLTVATIATLVPASRAAFVQPMRALREE